MCCVTLFLVLSPPRACSYSCRPFDEEARQEKIKAIVANLPLENEKVCVLVYLYEGSNFALPYFLTLF